MERFVFSSRLPYGIGGVNFMETYFCERTANFSQGRAQNALIYTADGVMTYWFGEQAIRVPQGEAIFIPAGTAHSTVYPPDGAGVVLIQFDVTEGRLPEYFGEPRSLGKCGIERDIDRIRSCIPHEPVGVFCAVFVLVERLARENEEIPALYRKILPAVQSIEKDFVADCSVAYLANLCCMSESGLRRLFREYVGVSPIDYRNGIRLDRAEQLIASGECSVSEAAAQVGFSNLSFFYRLYKRRFGRAPAGARGHA